MRQLIVSATTAALFCLATSLPLAAAENAELAALQGKWTTKKTNPDGQTYTQTLEIKKDKLTFKMMGSDGALRLMAKADLKTEKLGPFNVLKISEIEAGASPTELQAINDDRVNIYSLRQP